MAFVRNNLGNKIVAWGSDKAKDNSFVVEKEQYIEGTVKEVRDSEGTYPYQFILKDVVLGDADKNKVIEEVNEEILVLGNAVILRGSGYEGEKTKKGYELFSMEDQSAKHRIVKGDRVRFVFHGMVQAKLGKAYKVDVLYDDEYKE